MLENKVKERRLALGMTLEQLSKESGLPVSTINAIEHGREPGVRTAQILAAALLSNIDELWLYEP